MYSNAACRLLVGVVDTSRRLAAQLVLVAIALAMLASDTVAAAVKFGAAGDSLTDEYSFWGSLYFSPAARNWVDQWATLRPSEVDFGAYDSWDPTEFPGGPRYTGYEYNYARSGATSSALLGESQHTGVSSADVEYVYLGIGTNDFSSLNVESLGLVNKYGGIYAGGDPTALINQLVANFTTALNQIAGPVGSPTGIKVIVGNIGDYGDMPNTAAQGYTSAAGKALVTAAVAQANSQIEAIAASRGMPVVDVYNLLHVPQAPGPLVVGDFALTPGKPSVQNPSYLFLPDGIHPGTVWQGLLANAVIRAANAGYGADFTPLSDQEILKVARLTDPHGGTLTSYYPIAPFVKLVPEPGGLALGTIGLAALAGVGRNRRRRVWVAMRR